VEDALLTKMRAVIDKQEIHEVLLRYCRGVDRRDLDLVLSCFHEDATLDYGAMKGPPTILVPAVGTASSATSTHFLGNVLTETDGDVAFSEAYFLSFQTIDREGRSCTRIRAGRLLDRLERRASVWKIAERTLVDDWSRIDEIAAVIDGIGQNPGLRSRQDRVYELGQGIVGR
jgi:3-phenylpropionate/cinnamic acid dioxygenase small subunit